MKSIILGLFIVALFAVGCSSSNECTLSESYSPSASKYITDSGFEAYGFRVDLQQKVEIYRGDCANEKNTNYTTMKLTSFAPCEQTVNFTVNVGMGEDSYQVVNNGVVIQPQETIDFGVVREGGQRIDYAVIEVELYCPLCPEDLP